MVWGFVRLISGTAAIGYCLIVLAQLVVTVLVVAGMGDAAGVFIGAIGVLDFMAV